MIFEAILTESPQAQGLLRPLGSFEELLWQMDKRSPLHAALVAHVDGFTTIQAWRQALEQTRQRHPLWVGMHRRNNPARRAFSGNK